MTEEKWKVKKPDGSIYGPVSTGTLQKWIKEKRVLPEDFISREGKEEWKFARLLPLFQEFFGSSEQGKAKIAGEAHCPYCQKVLPPEATFCISCGTDLKTGKKVGGVVVARESPWIKRHLGSVVLALLIVLSGVGAFLFSRYIHPVNDIWIIVSWIVISAGETVCLYFIVRFVVVLAFVKKTPTTKIADIKKEGFFEVKGKVLCGAPEVVYGLKCVYYDYVHYTRKRDFFHSTRYRYVRDVQERKWVPFSVEDDTGEIGVNPAGAFFEPEVLNRGGSIIGEERDTLRGITVGSRVYILGEVINYNGTLQFEKKKSILPLVVSSKPESKLTIFLILRILLFIIIGILLPFGVSYLFTYIR
ncbi:MAG: hypothetical protein GXO71_00810 [Caldiserica bacterium]|nr:hypothetical protein [Caldisericota bacterium]